MKSFTDGLDRENSYFKIVVVGTSLGGSNALRILLSGIPKGFPVPIAIAQHRHPESENILNNFLQQYSILPIKEAEDKEAIVSERIYLAPANYHLLIEANDSFALSTEAPVFYARPSIDVLFESASDAYAQKVIGVVLTGANHDGAQGLAKIKVHGGLTIVQEPTTAASRTMPTAATDAVAVDYVLPLEEIAPLLVNICRSVFR